jgi:hypothetical protein
MAATEYVIGVTAGDFYDFYNAGVVQAPTALTGGSNRFASSTNQVGMTVIDHTLYAGDGTDPNCRFDGLTVAKSGSMQPTSACAATESGSAGNIADGTVTYKITYLDADGHESEPSDASNTVTVTGGGSQVDLTSIPNDTDADRSGKNVYRLGTTSSEYRLVNSTPLSATATTYTDNIADGDLGAILIEGNTLFPPCARLWEHDNRMWGCGNAVDPRTLFGSNEFEPWYCPASPDITDPTQGVRVRVQGANANIVGGISHGGYNFAFTDEGGYIVHGTSAEDYRMERFTHHGCVSHRSIQSIRDWLFWVAPDGIYRYNGQNVDRIDQDIEVYFETQTAANLSLVASWAFDDPPVPAPSSALTRPQATGKARGPRGSIPTTTGSPPSPTPTPPTSAPSALSSPTRPTALSCSSKSPRPTMMPRATAVRPRPSRLTGSPSRWIWACRCGTSGCIIGASSCGCLRA